jgi:aminoglycoside phosphotransferase family enzyme/predicted kinase
VVTPAAQANCGVMTTVRTIESGALGELSETFTPYAEVRETHSAVVFFLGDRAFKLKKPVDLGFLDFSSLPKRLEACRREVDLNRRLSPDVYLGVADVTGMDHLPAEHLVVMRRLPENRRLAHLVRLGVDVTDDVRRLAHVIAGFHGRCERSAWIAAEGKRDALAARWAGNIAQVRRVATVGVDQNQVDEVALLVGRYLDGRKNLFADRVRRGSIVDGHGDLLAEDIFLMPDGPRILDCIEFSDTLRHLDQLDDAAFLAMDLERLGAPELAAQFVGCYLEFTGDVAPPSLVHHYIAYRAFVRAEVACLRDAQGDPAAAVDAKRHLDLAQAHLREGAVRLILVGGSPGTGKSTLAAGLADDLGYTLISTDRVRKELAGVGEHVSLSAAYEEGHYTWDWTEHTYADLLRRAGILLAMGESVVLDGTWSDPRWRQLARDLAHRTSSDIHELRCELAAELAIERIAARAGISDADAGIAVAMDSRFEAWPEARSIETRLDPSECLAVARGRVAPKQVASAVPRPRMLAD